MNEERWHEKQAEKMNLTAYNKLLKELADVTSTPDNVQTIDRYEKTFNYLEGKMQGNILDVGKRTQFTVELEKRFKISVYNTKGDLDLDFYIPDGEYDVIIYSHTLEHQLNHLSAMLKLKDVLKTDGTLYLMLPDRGKLLWCNNHYHEIDDYRVKLLLKRAGLEVISKTRHKVWRHWKIYFTGLRPLLRLFLEYNAIYEVKNVQKGQ
jgi:SAM-dependent methyltransferase